MYIIVLYKKHWQSYWKVIWNDNDKEDESRYLISEVLEKFNGKLSTLINRKKEVFILNTIIRHSNELCYDSGTEPTFTYTVSLKPELLQKFEN